MRQTASADQFQSLKFRSKTLFKELLAKFQDSHNVTNGMQSLPCAQLDYTSGLCHGSGSGDDRQAYLLATDIAEINF